MFSLIVMLVFAMIPTGNYSWGDDAQSSTPSPGDYAVCYMQRVHDWNMTTYASMVISIVLLTLGFVLRAIRLFKVISVYLVGKLRKAVSEKMRTWLRKLYDKCDVQTSSKNPKRMLIYRPVFAVFLVMRAVLDVWSSMFFEVCSAFLTPTPSL